MWGNAQYDKWFSKYNYLQGLFGRKKKNVLLKKNDSLTGFAYAFIGFVTEIHLMANYVFLSLILLSFSYGTHFSPKWGLEND